MSLQREENGDIFQILIRESSNNLLSFFQENIVVNRRIEQ